MIAKRKRDAIRRQIERATERNKRLFLYQFPGQSHNRACLTWGYCDDAHILAYRYGSDATLSRWSRHYVVTSPSTIHAYEMIQEQWAAIFAINKAIRREIVAGHHTPKLLASAIYSAEVSAEPERLAEIRALTPKPNDADPVAFFCERSVYVATVMVESVGLAEEAAIIAAMHEAGWDVEGGAAEQEDRASVSRGQEGNHEAP
jgi:hypothetical protein